MLQFGHDTWAPEDGPSSLIGKLLYVPTQCISAGCVMLTWQMTICSKGRALSLRIKLSWVHGQPGHALTKPSGPLKPEKNQGPFSRDLIYSYWDLVFIQKILGFNEYIVDSHLSMVTYKVITEIKDLDVQLVVLSGMIV